MLARVGLGAVADVPLITVPHLDDTLRVMHVFPRRVRPQFRALMDTVAVELKLAKTLRGDVASRTEPSGWRQAAREGTAGAVALTPDAGGGPPVRTPINRNAP